MAISGEEFDFDILGSMDDLGYAPSLDERKKMMGSFDQFEEKGEQEAVGPRVAVIGTKDFQGETLFCIRLSLPKRDGHLWFFKPYSAFSTLEENLRQNIENRAWGESVGLSHLPELPPDERFGIRRRLSLLGLGDFLTQQQAALQTYLDELLVQLPDISAEPLIQQFFAASTQLDVHRDLMDEAIVEAGADVTLHRMAGYWKLKGSMHIWTLEKSGTAMLNGKHRGPEYDLTESGEGTQRAITRPDGWQVDLERSSVNMMIWYQAGHKDLEWGREATEQAEALIRKYAAKRALLEKAKAAKEATIASEKLAAVQEAGEAAKA